MAGKKKGSRSVWGRGLVVVLAVSGVAFLLSRGESSVTSPTSWKRLAKPGHLSAAHAHLEDDCLACHTPNAGVQPSKCIVCHANDQSILQRQPTAFHAGISSCTECHPEHRGVGKRPTGMDHAALAHIGLRQLDVDDSPDSESRLLADKLREWIDSTGDEDRPGPSHVSMAESVLRCGTCHANDDRHFGLFGLDCVLCHATDRWTIPDFRHPSPASTDCAQCHQAPPSHYMMHFSMISARVAGKPHAKLHQCQQCHQTTSWNDILGAGWYKHH